MEPMIGLLGVGVRVGVGVFVGTGVAVGLGVTVKVGVAVGIGAVGEADVSFEGVGVFSSVCERALSVGDVRFFDFFRSSGLFVPQPQRSKHRRVRISHTAVNCFVVLFI
jgi:hypothetical protein